MSKSTGSTALVRPVWVAIAPFAIALLLGASHHLRADENATRSGTVQYRPPAGEEQVAERFRLPAHAFRFEERPAPRVSEKYDVTTVTFPSPVETKHEANNTVHCEYFCPSGAGRRPAVIVLHILGGDFWLSRLVCSSLASRGVGALFLKMPYYGPRRAPGSARRMISRDPRETVAGMTQAVLDIRRATAWLASRDEVDADRLGICGISLGGITGALALAAEPRLKNACLILAGGDMGKIGWESPELEKVRRFWIEQGGTRQEYFEIVRAIDPVTYAAAARDRRILMINARDDEVIPKSCTQSLHQALGNPEIVWYAGTHYTVARHLLSIIERTTVFFEP